VYSRRRTRRRAVAEEGATEGEKAAAEEEGAAAAPALQPTSPATAFLLKLTKSPSGLLPIPRISKRRKKLAPPPSDAPRRNRRIAGLDAEKPEVCPIHLKKRVMRALDLDVEEDRIQLDQNLLDEYAKRFSQHVSSSYTRALAALFGWAPTEEDYVVGPVECLV